ncbi:MAG: PqqD family protein [Pseudomarimonas sp.]
MITLQSHIKLSDEVLVQEVEGEAVLLDLKSEQYFGLDSVGVQLWRSLNADGSLSHAHATLLAMYDVAPEQLEGDLIRIVGELEQAGLAQVAA